MGMFDTVYVPCPSCDEPLAFQSKGGACILAEYTLGNAPADVLSDVNRHSPMKCKCGALVRVELEGKIRPWVINSEIVHVGK